MKRFLFIILAVFLFSGCTKNTDEIVEIEQHNIQEKTLNIEQDNEEVYDFFGSLEDVSGVKISGVAMAGYVDGKYILRAEFMNLPEPSSGFFYEGWVVRKTPFDFISTGELIIQDGKYLNVFTSQTNYTDHDFYVLTIEPNDDGENGQPDPAPAEHLLEGTLERIK